MVRGFVCTSKCTTVLVQVFVQTAVFGPNVQAYVQLACTYACTFLSPQQKSGHQRPPRHAYVKKSLYLVHNLYLIVRVVVIVVVKVVYELCCDNKSLAVKGVELRATLENDALAAVEDHLVDDLLVVVDEQGGVPVGLPQEGLQQEQQGANMDAVNKAYNMLNAA